MASELNSTTTIKPAKSSAQTQKSARVKQYVNHQLEKTRRQVKTTDLIGGILTMVAFTLGFLLLVAIWDAWIWPLSVVGRWICLGLLIAACLTYAVLSILPLLLKKINPEYAAKMIEEAKPSFKNSLLNYVSLRKKNKAVNPAVFDAVSRQAATDLASVPSDATVDRSKLIRLGFVLIGLLAFAVGYKMLSPKDPLQTFGRILSPNAKIAKPAVVKISDVQPGDTNVFFGDQVTVTAVVRGRHDPQDVMIEYSTIDGQLIDQRVPMIQEEVPGRYRADLSLAGGGIRQSLNYRIVARDGSSPDFEILVKPNPTIAVESLVLTPPTYTKLPVRTLEGQGSIDVLEGTEVVIHAAANLPIKMAFIELLDEIGDANQTDDEVAAEKKFNVVRPIEMRSEGQSAVVRIVAQLNASRKKPFASHYRIKFISEEGNRNQKPNIYPIRIKPDLAPEVVILNPTERDVYVAENGSVAIDIEANDLDFEIASVALHIDHQGAKLLQQDLALKSNNGNQRVSARYLLKPEELRLKEGDKAIFFATASDNRTSPQSGQHDPNISRTENFTLTVTEREEQPEQQQQQNPESQQDPNRQEDSDQNQSSDGETGDGEQGAEGQQGSEQSEDSQSGSEQGNESGSEQMSSDEKNQSGQNSGSEQQSENDSGEQSGQSGGSQSSSDGESGNDNSQQNEASQSGSDSEGQSPDQNQGSESQSSSNESADTGNSQSGGSEGTGDQTNNQGNVGRNETGRGDNGEQTDQQDAGGGQSQRDEGLTDGQRQPLSEDASEGEQFQRLQEMLENQSDRSSSDQNQSDAENDSGDSSSGQTSEGSDQASQGGQAQSEQDPNGGESTGQNDSGQEQNAGESTQPGQSEGNPGEESTQDGSSGKSDGEQSSNQSSNSEQSNESASEQSGQPGNSANSQSEESMNEQQQSSGLSGDQSGSTQGDQGQS